MESKDKPQISTTSNTPYGSSYVDNAFSEAQRIYGQGVGQAWKGNVLAPMNSVTANALDWTKQLAGSNPVGIGQAQTFASNMISGNGMTPDLQRTAGYLTPFADGSMQEDPRLAQALETNANRAANAAATRFGGGRYGSAAIGQGVGQAVADANNATMLQSNENSRNRQMQASGLLGNMYESGLGRSFQASSMLPMLDNLRYASAERLAGVGDYEQNRAQTEQDAQIAQYEGQQAYPWMNLNNYNSIVRGLGSLGSTSIGIKPQTGASTAQKAIGGVASGAAAGSMFGPWGTAIGGVGGGLLGAFG